MRVTILMIAVCLMIGAGCRRGDDQSPSASQKPKVRLESINSVSPETLDPRGPGIERTASGVATKLIHRGSGHRHVTNRDALVLYSQTYDDTGRVLARGSELIGDPAVDLTKDGQEAIQMMAEGDVRRFWFPDPEKPGRIKVADYEVVWISPDKDQ